MGQAVSMAVYTCTNAYPYLPASRNVSRGRPRPIAAISARFPTLLRNLYQGSLMRCPIDNPYAVLLELPHFSMTGIQRSRMSSAWGMTFGAFSPGYFVS